MTNARIGYVIRQETRADIEAIRALNLAEFSTSAEADLVDRLRQDGDLTISMIAESGRSVVGYIGFSTMSAPFRALGLAPLSVSRDAQGQGIGTALVHEGVKVAADLHYQAVFVLGDPAFYSCLGFSVDRAASYVSPYAGPNLMIRVLGHDGLPTEGRVDYAAAFSGL